MRGRALRRRSCIYEPVPGRGPGGRHPIEHPKRLGRRFQVTTRVMEMARSGGFRAGDDRSADPRLIGIDQPCASAHERQAAPMRGKPDQRKAVMSALETGAAGIAPPQVEAFSFSATGGAK